VLSLDDPRWATLRHAYGTAQDVPDMLRRLAETKDAWDEIWSALCHQGSIYSASYAAAPHIVEMARRVPPRQRVTFCVFLGCVASPRPEDDAVPTELADDLREAASAASRLVVSSLLDGAPSETETVYLLEAFARLHGCIEATSSELEQALGDGEAVCRSCAQAFTLRVESRRFTDETRRDLERGSAAATFVARNQGRLDSVRAVLRSNLRSGWEPRHTASLLGFLAAVAGHEALAERIFSLEAPLACPECGAWVNPLGDLGGGSPGDGAELEEALRFPGREIRRGDDDRGGPPLPRAGNPEGG
jgi:hypothetical protein